MALPGSKAPLPGYRLIVDSAGNYIDDVPNIRLGPEFVLTRNAADPSANISVAAAIATAVAAGPSNSGSAAGRFGLEKLIDEAVLSGSSYSSPSWTGGAYRSLRFVLRFTGGTSTQTDVALTGLTGTYASAYYYINVSGLSTPGCFGYNNKWFLDMGSGSAAVINGTVDIQSGSARMLKWTGAQSSKLVPMASGHMTDTTNEVTQLTMAFGATVTGFMTLWGLPA